MKQYLFDDFFEKDSQRILNNLNQICKHKFPHFIESNVLIEKHFCHLRLKELYKDLEENLYDNKLEYEKIHGIKTIAFEIRHYIKRCKKGYIHSIKCKLQETNL